MEDEGIVEDYQQGRFLLLSSSEALRETRLLIANLDGTFELLSDHVSNFAWINGNIPNDKLEMLEIIDRLLAVPENNFRQVDSRYL
ncbi:MAG: hypothetical protein ACYDEJ_06735 [Desulfitobacteriaceae bacterium]